MFVTFYPRRPRILMVEDVFVFVGKSEAKELWFEVGWCRI